MKRVKSREVVMELIFQMSINKAAVDETLENFKENTEYDLDSLDMEYIVSTLKGVHDNQENIDKTIEEFLVGWKISRISKINLAILRLGTYELLYSDIPPKVVINEAVNLSKKYSEESSTSFVNGVLDKISKK